MTVIGRVLADHFWQVHVAGTTAVRRAVLDSRLRLVVLFQDLAEGQVCATLEHSGWEQLRSIGESVLMASDVGGGRHGQFKHPVVCLHLQLVFVLDYATGVVRV